MRGVLLLLLPSVVVTLACGGNNFDVASEDAAPAVDGSMTDSVVVDSANSDTRVGDTMNTMTDAPEPDTGTCEPFWCGCGTCVAVDIVCTKSPPGCPLGCPVAPCPAAEKEGVCTTVGGRCVRNGIEGPIACYTSADCPPGKCCSGASTPPTHGVCGAC